MAGPKIVDEATTVAMIRAFNECSTECDSVQKLVDSTYSTLMATWGGVAAKRYGDSMAEWQKGFKDVQDALNMLDLAMVDFAKNTETTEDDNIARGSGWAHGAL